MNRCCRRREYDPFTTMWSSEKDRPITDLLTGANPRYALVPAIRLAMIRYSMAADWLTVRDPATRHAASRRSGSTGRLMPAIWAG